MELRKNVLSFNKTLFVVQEVAHYVEFKKILAAALAKEKITPHFLFDFPNKPYAAFQARIQDCQDSETPFTVLNYENLKRTSKAEIFLARINSYLNSRKFHLLPLRKLLISLNYSIGRAVTQILYYRRKINYLRYFINNNGFSSVILGEENILLESFLYVKAATKIAKVILYPYTIPNPKEMAGGAWASSDTKTLRGKLLYFLGGRWTKRIRGRVYLLVSPGKIFSMLMIGYLPKSPWILNHGDADVLCVENQKMLDLYKSYNFPSASLKMVGTFNDDIIAEVKSNKQARIAAIQEKYNLPDKPIVLVGFPPNQFPRPQSNFTDYLSVENGIREFLEPYQSEFNIVISKHPRIIEPLADLKSAGFVIASEPTIELIPLAHLYIASCSATIRWAIAAQVPVINYDLYNFGYEDFKDSTGVITINSLLEFREALNSCLQNKIFYSELKAKQINESKTWGVTDGRVANRFLNLLPLSGSTM